MTVRTIVTASGRVTFTGSGYSSAGEARREDGGSIDGSLRIELDRTLAAANRANNATVRADGDRVTVVGDPTEAALLVPRGRLASTRRRWTPGCRAFASFPSHRRAS
jgi:Ca2+-transporting ATPase